MFARGLAAALLALLISGDVARLGWGVLSLWYLTFPYVWLFVLLEAVRARRRVGDGEVFLAGTAMAMLYGGIYAKDLQYGPHPFGVDWLGVLGAAFDGGMTTVLALHVAARLVPRPTERGRDTPLPYGWVAPFATLGFLIFVLGAASAVYAVKTALDFYRADRMLGPTWLVADLLFAGAAWFLARRAWRRAEEDSEGERERGIWALAAFAVWLPGSRIIARACLAVELPMALAYFFVGAWTVAAAGLFWRLWRERAYADGTATESAAVAGSRPALAAALWRAAGALLLVAWLGEDLNDVSAAGIFSAAIDWPSRALFAWAFLTSRLEV
ncbi:MAG: hypothetical protein Q8T11_11725 [Elusimicrobiota bacterium]|nr:hypothetical protein [Elusimicrobiota bacterium]